MRKSMDVLRTSRDVLKRSSGFLRKTNLRFNAHPKETHYAIKGLLRKSFDKLVVFRRKDIGKLIVSIKGHAVKAAEGVAAKDGGAESKGGDGHGHHADAEAAQRVASSMQRSSLGAQPSAASPHPYAHASSLHTRPRR